MVRKILCNFFGHKPPVYAKKGWYSPGEEYAKVDGNIVTDGIDRKHTTVSSICPRCNETFKHCRIHLPKEEKCQDVK